MGCWIWINENIYEGRVGRQKEKGSRGYEMFVLTVASGLCVYVQYMHFVCKRDYAYSFIKIKKQDKEHIGSTGIWLYLPLSVFWSRSA